MPPWSMGGIALRLALMWSGSNAVQRSPRRFPHLGRSKRDNDACFIVRDKNGQALGYFSFEDEPGRRSAAKPPTRDEARRLAANFAKLPELLRKP